MSTTTEESSNIPESPRRGSGGGSNSAPPPMGVPGQSAFKPYTRPPHWVSSRASGTVVVGARKRVRDGPFPDFTEVKCSVCGKVFMSSKALFGHLRTHPGRGWRGAHPPPVFRAEEGPAEDDNYKVPDLNNPPPADDSA